MHGNNVDATALLGDSEVFAVKHTPRDTIPEFVQRLEYDGEVSSSVAREKAENVFEDNNSRVVPSNKAHKVMKESRLSPSKPRSWAHSRQREVLAGESCGPNICIWNVFIVKFPDVVVYRNLWPMSAKNLATEGIDFTVKPNVESGTLKPEVQAADSRKEGCDSVR